VSAVAAGIRPGALQVPIMRRAIAAVSVALVAWSIQDILLWQRIFEANGLYQYDLQYQYWHQAFLILLIVLGAAWLHDKWGLWFALATWTLANSGLADVLYYWLDGRAIPQTLPWLDSLHPLLLFHPSTNVSVVASSAVWVGFWVLSLVVIRFTSRAG
jgi:hypothetical protein